MFNSSKSTRNFAKGRVIILLFLLFFISGYALNQVVPFGGSVAAKTFVETVTTPSSVSTTTITTTVTNDSVVSGNSSTSSTGTVSSTTSSTSSTVSSNAALYTIPQSTLLRALHGNSSDVNLAPSSTKVPYYVVTQTSSKTPVGLIYLTTDVAPASCYGYNAQIGTVVMVNATGTIKALYVYSIQDSWGYMITQTWLNTYVNRSVFERLQIGSDAQPVTGATYSSTGVVDGVRDAGRIVVNDYQQQQKAAVSGTAIILGPLLNIFGSVETSSYVTNVSLIALVCLFIAAVVAFELKREKIRYVVVVASIAFIGFYAVRMVTMGDFTDFVHWRFPPFWNNLYWYVLYGGVLVTSLIWGRFYCGFLCPFGTFTDTLNKISPLKLKIPLKYQSKLRYAKYIVLAIVVFEIFEKTILYQVEPFGTLFLFRGDTFAWIFLGSILGISIFFNRFYCKYICPAGAGMALLSRFRIREIKRWPECKKCMICANQCEPQAIKGDHISAFECMNCRGCEKLYLNKKICPHYALERAIAKKQH